MRTWILYTCLWWTHFWCGQTDGTAFSQWTGHVNAVMSRDLPAASNVDGAATWKRGWNVKFSESNIRDKRKRKIRGQTFIQEVRAAVHQFYSRVRGWWKRGLISIWFGDTCKETAALYTFLYVHCGASCVRPTLSVSALVEVYAVWPLLTFLMTCCWWACLCLRSEIPLHRASFSLKDKRRWNVCLRMLCVCSPTMLTDQLG